MKHGFAKVGSRNSLYNSWQNMKSRCLRKSHPKYARYGGRGVSIFEPWLSFIPFKEWAEGAGWSEGLSIDRIDNNGNYTPENCRWITMSENSRTKRTTKLTFVQAQEIRIRIDRGECEYALAEEYGVVRGTIWFIKKKFTHVPDGDCAKAIKERNKKNG